MISKSIVMITLHEKKLRDRNLLAVSISICSHIDRDVRFKHTVGQKQKLEFSCGPDLICIEKLQLCMFTFLSIYIMNFFIRKKTFCLNIVSGTIKACLGAKAKAIMNTTNQISNKR